MVLVAYKLVMENYDNGQKLHKLVPQIRDKILDLIEKYRKDGYSLERIGELCGITKVHLSTLRSGKRGKNLSLSIALKIWEGLGNPPETLLSPKIVQPIITVLGQVPEIPSWMHPENYLAVPMVEGRIAAGPGRMGSNEINDLVWVYKPEIGNRHNLVAFKLAVDAESMEPTLHPGDIVIIDRDDKHIVPKGMYAVRSLPECCAIKRIRVSQGRIWLVSDNPDFPPEISEYEDLIELIVGRVVWSWTSWVR